VGSDREQVWATRRTSWGASGDSSRFTLAVGIERAPRDRIVLPGDAIAALATEARVKVGPGVRRDGSRLVAAKAGVVKARNASAVWLESRQRRVRGAGWPVTVVA